MLYLIALGSNQRHQRLGLPRDILAAALQRLTVQGLTISATSAVIGSRPVGPSQRSYANAVAIVETAQEPAAFACRDPALTIPHPLMRERGFVLGPATEIAGDWRDPLTSRTITQLHARNRRPKKRPEKAPKRLDHETKHP